MAIIKETGTASSTANSYASEGDLATYALNRGISITADGAELLFKAMDYLEQQNFKGEKYTDAQALQWPRSGVMIDQFGVDADEIPVLLIEAQIELAIGVDGGTNPLANVSRETIREKVGEIEVEYSTGASNQTYLKAAHYKLKKLLKAGNSIQVMRG